MLNGLQAFALCTAGLSVPVLGANIHALARCTTLVCETWYSGGAVMSGVGIVTGVVAALLIRRYVGGECDPGTI